MFQDQFISSNIPSKQVNELDEEKFDHQDKIKNEDISNQTQVIRLKRNQQQKKALNLGEVSQDQINSSQNHLNEKNYMNQLKQYEEINNQQKQEQYQQKQQQQQQQQYQRYETSYQPFLNYQQQYSQQQNTYNYQQFSNYEQQQSLQEQQDFIKLQQLLKTPEILKGSSVKKKIKKNTSNSKIISKQKEKKNKSLLDYQFKIQTNKNQKNQIQSNIQQDHGQELPQKQQEQNITNDKQKFDTKIKVSDKPQIIKPSGSIYGIIGINDDRILYHTKQSIGILEDPFKKGFQRSEQGCQSPIVGFQVNKAGQVILQTETHVILYSKDLQLLDQFKEKIEKNLLTYSQEVYQSDFLIYFSNKENTLIKVEILNSSHKFGKSLILFKTVKPISIKIIQNEKLFLGYSNGQIKQYSLKSNQLINNYQIKQENSIQMIFSSIIFRKQFCLGIIQNRILKLNYLSKQTENFLNATQNISQFSYYYDSQENIYIIHALLENNKIYKSKMINGKEIDGKYYLFKQNSLVYIWLPKWLHKWILNQVNLNNNYLYINNQKCQNQLHQYQSFFLFQNA
ncbi:unnamed protein product [Paramecium sonneborni]|uniref:WD40-repeat-containing domain n=1 Tax=Paramecium sonneborni TaxID=65129 RepID=A0A8S1QYQ8_9CILI|nr:unnamed protein product [Paramecium sonneborni]